MGFMFAKIGREQSCELAREYCRRGEYFYRLFVEAGGDDFVYEQAHVEGYAEGLPFLSFITELDSEHPAFVRGLEVRQLTPRLGQF